MAKTETERPFSLREKDRMRGVEISKRKLFNTFPVGKLRDPGLTGSGQGDRRGRYPTLGSVFGYHCGVDAAAHVELGAQPHETGFGGAHQISENFVGHRFMEGPLVTKRPDVHLQRLQLHTTLIRHIFQGHLREIGLPGLRAKTGELGNRDADRVVSFRAGIVEGFQIFAGLAGHG
jgi:hypothetical protein